MNGIEQGLQIYFGVFAGSVGIYLNGAAGCALQVKGFRMQLIAVVEIQFLADGFQGSVKQDIFLVQDNDGV